MAIPFNVPAPLWSDAEAASLAPEELLLYRSRLIGGGPGFGGGNTSAKLAMADPLTGESVQVLWVGGSGGDLGSMKLDGFATLYLDKLWRLERLWRDAEHENEMAGALPHCIFNLNPRAAGIDTALHAYLPFAHVDHVHPDAVIALAACSNGRQAVEEIYGREVGWLAWQRPGFELGLRLRDAVAGQAGLKGIVIENHGLVVWGADSRSCYLNTVELVARAARYLNDKLEGRPAFGGEAVAPASAAERAGIAADLMPRLRRLMGSGRIGHFSDDAETLEFTCSRDFEPLAALGAPCPVHFRRTGIAPLVLAPQKLDDSRVAHALDRYRRNYKIYYERNAGPDDPPMRDANPVIVLVSGVGRFAFGPDKTTARLAGEFFGNAINAMRGATAIGRYVALAEREAFRIEYWTEAAPKRMPGSKALTGRVAVITGGGGGIGRAIAVKLLEAGASVMLADIDVEALESARTELCSVYGRDAVRAVACDVTDERQVQTVFDAVAREYGGLDIAVAGAGLATAATIEQTSLALWEKNYDVLAKGYFLTARAAFPLLKQAGGSLVFIGAKNALAAIPDAAAYASSKAAAVHLARCLALEGAPFGIRVNVVNPDAVLRGSHIWTGSWRAERARVHGVDAGEGLEAHYRARSLLKRDVLPEDIAEAVYFFAGDASSKSTGNIINVDAGNVQAFTR